MTRLRGRERVAGWGVMTLMFGLAAGAVWAAEPQADLWKKLLDDGFAPGTKGLAVARQAQVDLKKSGVPEAQLDYAHGLTLVQHLKFREAQEAFARAASAKTVQPTYGAWEGEIWCRLTARDLKGAYPRMEAYAKMLVNEQHAVPPAQQQKSARWLGRVLSAVEETLEVPAAQENHAVHVRVIRSILGDGNSTAFEAGEAESESDEADAQTTLAAVPSAAKPGPSAPVEGVPATENLAGEGQPAPALTKREKQEAERIEKTQKRSEQARENVKRTGEQWKTWYEDNVARIDVTLNQLVSSAQGLQAGMSRVQNEYQQIKLREAQLSRLSPKPGSAAYAELTNLSNRAGALAGEGQQLSLDFLQVQRQGMAALQQRQAIVRTYEQATGLLVKQDENLKRMQDKLSEKADAGVPKAGKGKAVKGKVASKKAKAPLFKDLVNFETETRRDELLAELGLSVPAATDPQ